MQGTLLKINEFLQRDILQKDIPDRNTISNVGGLWVKKKSDWKLDMPDDLLKRFNKSNEDTLRSMGYLL